MEHWLHSNVNVLNTTELYLKMVKLVNVMCILSQLEIIFFKKR